MVMRMPSPNEPSWCDRILDLRPPSSGKVSRDLWKKEQICQKVRLLRVFYGFSLHEVLVFLSFNRARLAAFRPQFISFLTTGASFWFEFLR